MNQNLLLSLTCFLVILIVFFAANRALAQKPTVETETFGRFEADDRSRSAAADFEKVKTPLVEVDETLKVRAIEAEKTKPVETDLIQPPVRDRFHWKPALVESGIMLGGQHAFRMLQKRTRKELSGPFFKDWAQSAKHLSGWQDGDSIFVNYIAHPMQGSTTGRIFINNSDRARKQEFGKSKKYWESRLKAMAWSAVWSTQFELGPISEATLGNVGLRRTDRHKMAWVDMVMTPVGGTAFLVGEDAIDKYVLKKWLERRTDGKTTVKIKLLRSLLTPTMSVSNLLRRKAPWQRDNRLN